MPPSVVLRLRPKKPPRLLLLSSVRLLALARTIPPRPDASPHASAPQESGSGVASATGVVAGAPQRNWKKCPKGKPRGGWKPQRAEARKLDWYETPPEALGRRAPVPSGARSNTIASKRSWLDTDSKPLASTCLAHGGHLQSRYSKNSLTIRARLD